jgi:hypothetical protein
MAKVAQIAQKRLLLTAMMIISALSVLSPVSPQAHAQSVGSSEQYQELFTAAGYSTLFGAALGTAILPFLPSDSISNLRVIAGGASIGFIAGSLLAFYNMRQQQQHYGMQYYPDASSDASAQQWQWDVGSTNGKDLFVKMDSRF